MAQDVTFAGLDPVAVDEYADLLATLLREAYPSLNFNKGSMLYELVVSKASAMHVYEGTPLSQLRDNWNMIAVKASPNDVDPTLVDQILSNLNVERSPGVAASGEVEVIVSTNAPLTVTAGTNFLAGTVRFQNVVDVVVVASEADATNSTDKVFARRTNGTYSFRVPVVANEAGSDGNIGQGTAIAMSPPPTFFVSATVAADFGGGSDVETNAEVIARIPSRLSGRLLSSPSNAAALLLNNFQSATAASIVGAADPEMTRDQVSLLGVSVGGKADLYLRAQNAVGVSVITVTAERTNSDTNTYEIVLGRDVTAGAYRVVSVVPQGAAATGNELGIVSEVWGFDNTGNPPVPYIASAADAAFSMYQTVTITFTDPANKGTYDVRLLQMQLIDSAQAFCLADTRRDPLGDWLVRAPVPVLTGVSLKICVPAGETVDVDRIKDAAAAAVCNRSFCGELNASTLITTVDAVLPPDAYVAMPVDMVGEIIPPSRESKWLRSAHALVVPYEPALGISKKTVAFFANADDIDVQVETV
jgi:hypothetical protein